MEWVPPSEVSNPYLPINQYRWGCLYRFGEPLELLSTLTKRFYVKLLLVTRWF